MSQQRNIPIPAGPRAPVGPMWLLTTGPFAGIIALYRMIPPARRANWNKGISTSHIAMAAVLAPGGGRKAFARFTKPQLRTRRHHGYAVAWMLFLVSVVVPSLRIAQQPSWAN